MSGLSCTRAAEIFDVHWRGDTEALSNNLKTHQWALLRVLIGKHEKALEVLYGDYLLLYYTVAVTEKEGVSQHGRSNWRLVWFNGYAPCLRARETLDRGDFDKEWKIRVHTVKQHDHTSYKVHLRFSRPQEKSSKCESKLCSKQDTTMVEEDHNGKSNDQKG